MKQRTLSKKLIQKRKKKKFTFRKEEFEILYHYLEDPETGETFEDESSSELNAKQLHNLYRVKHNLPFPEEIQGIREKYRLSASKMAEILGFGINQYRNYENGEIPSISNGRLIQVASDPSEFKRILDLSDSLSGKEHEKLTARIDELRSSKRKWQRMNIVENYLIGNKKPDQYTGFRSPDLDKFCHMVMFFAKETRPFKTKMNKLMFYADFKNFQSSCFSISGLRYRAIQFGPVPNNFQSLYEFAARRNYIDIVYDENSDGRTTEEYRCSEKKEFNKRLFSSNELKTMNEIVKCYGKMSTKKIVNISHDEKAWMSCQDKRSMINYEHAFELGNL